MNTNNINKQHKLVAREEKILRYKQNKPYKECREFEESRVREYVLAGFVLLDSSQSHCLQVSPPSGANIETECNVAACRDEDEKDPGRISIS